MAILLAWLPLAIHSKIDETFGENVCYTVLDGSCAGPDPGWPPANQETTR